MLQIARGSVKVYKGKVSDVESYSCFWDNNKANESCLNANLRERGVTDCYICGIASDVCVGELFRVSSAVSLPPACIPIAIHLSKFMHYGWPYLKQDPYGH